MRGQASPGQSGLAAPKPRKLSGRKQGAPRRSQSQRSGEKPGKTSGLNCSTEFKVIQSVSK
jgi:hypothetical protein